MGTSASELRPPRERSASTAPSTAAPTGSGLGAALRLYGRGRVLLMLLLGFSAGLPWMLSGATLLAWLQNVGVRVTEIAAFSLVSLPYSLKVLWAPLVDRFAPLGRARGGFPGLGRRRGWILCMQLAIVAVLLLLGRSNPVASPWRVAALALLLATLSATQDIAIDAYRTDLLPPDEAAAGVATYVLGYRIAMIVSSAVALRLVDVWGRNFGRVYVLMALLMLPLPLAALCGPEPTRVPAPRTLGETVVAPLAEFFRRRGALLALAFLMIYRLGDVVLASFSVPFLLGAGYSNTEVADATKLLGLLASILGALSGGPLVARLGLFRALLLFGIAQAFAHLGYAGLSAHGPFAPAWRLPALYGAVAIDSFCTGLAVAATGAFLISLCDRRYSATQGALLTGASSLCGRLFGGTTGLLVERWGWTRFFVLAALLGLPALFILRRLRRLGVTATNRTPPGCDP